MSQPFIFILLYAISVICSVFLFRLVVRMEGENAKYLSYGFMAAISTLPLMNIFVAFLITVNTLFDTHHFLKRIFGYGRYKG